MDKTQILSQLLAGGQSQPGGSPMDWLKSFIRPDTPPGALANQDPYNDYVLQAMDRGENPMPRMEFLRMMQGGG